MNKYTKAVLMMIALNVYALPVRAYEIVYYCEMTGLARTTLEGAETFKAQKFRMKVTLREVVFGSGGYFNNAKLEIASSTGPFTFFAKNNNNILVFENEAIAVSARCDKF